MKIYIFIILASQGMNMLYQAFKQNTSLNFCLKAFCKDNRCFFMILKAPSGGIITQRIYIGESFGYASLKSNLSHLPLIERHEQSIRRHSFKYLQLELWKIPPRLLENHPTQGSGKLQNLHKPCNYTFLDKKVSEEKFKNDHVMSS